MKRVFLILILFITILGSNFAQFDITTEITLPPPYPTNLDLYVDFLEEGIIEISNNTNNTLDVFFEVRFEEVNGKLNIITNGILGQSVAIDPGLNLLSPIQVQTIFADLSDSDFNTPGLTQAEREAMLINKQIPEGSYQICIRAFDETGKVLSDPANDYCFFFEVVYPERPIILSPYENEEVDTSGFLNPVWDHVINDFNVMDRTEYILKIIDLTEQAIDIPINAMLDPGISPEYEENIGNQNAITLLNDIDLPLIKNHRYAIRVTAVDPDGLTAYQFGGHSEIVTFYYGSDLSSEFTALTPPIITEPTLDQVLSSELVNIEWNHSLNQNITDLSSLTYRMRIANVDGLDQDEVNDYFKTESSIFLFSEIVSDKIITVESSALPLVSGSRYAIQIAVENPEILGDNFEFDNQGNSEIISFMFDDLGNEELDTLQSNHVSGQVIWAFKRSEESNQTSNNQFIVDSANDLAVEKIKNIRIRSSKGNQTYPLEGATVRLLSLPDQITLGVGTTNSEGEYSISLNDAYLSLLGNTQIEVTHTGSFENYSSEIFIPQTENGFRIDPIQMNANNMRLSVQVLKEDMIDEPVSVNLLLQEDTYQAYPYMNQASPINANRRVEFNADNYIVVERLESSDIHRSIFQNLENYENYVLQVEVPNRPSVFRPLNSFYYETSRYGKKQLIYANRNIVYNVGAEIGGKIFFGNDPRRDARVRLSFDPEDVAGTYDPNIEYIRVTDVDGSYYFDNLPALNVGARFSIEITDRTIREQPFVREFTYDGSTPQVEDIVLKNEIYTAFGRLLDQYGLPIRNAMIQVDSSQTVYSTQEGFYMFKLVYPLPATIKIIADGYSDGYIYPSESGWTNNGFGNITQINQDQSDAKRAQSWKDLLESSNPVSAFMTEKEISDINAEHFGIGYGPLVNRYSSYFRHTETLSGIIQLVNDPMVNAQGLVYISAKFEGELVDARIKFIGEHIDLQDKLSSKDIYTLTGQDGLVNFEIIPIEGETPFVQFFGEVEIEAGYPKYIYIDLQAGTTVSGIVKNKATNQALASAKVQIEGTEFITETDDNGEYTLYLPLNEEYTYKAKKSKFNSSDTTFIATAPMAHNFFLEPRDQSLPDFTLLAGHPIEIDQLSPEGDGYRISGELTLLKNELWSIANTVDSKLLFSGVYVNIEDGNVENCIPAANFSFESAELNAVAYGFVPVRITGSPLIELRMLETEGLNTSNTAVIGGSKLSLQFESESKFSAFPFSFPSATIYNIERRELLTQKLDEVGIDITGMNEEEIYEATFSGPGNEIYNEYGFERQFISSGKKIADISLSNSYKVVYDEKGNLDLKGTGYHPSDGYDGYVLSKFAKTKLLIEEDQSILTQNGVEMQGALEIPKIIGTKLKVKDNRVGIDKLIIGQNFSINELTFQVSPNKPLRASIKTWQARMSTMSMFGLGTPNLGIGFGGDIIMKKDRNLSGQDSSHLVINSFKIINTADAGLTISADLSLQPKGLKVGPLKVIPGENNSISMSLSPSSFAFEIGASNLKLESSSRNALTEKVFPLEILQFNLRSNDWATLLALKPNIKFDFGVIKVQLDRFLLNYGYNMDMDGMNEILTMSDEERDAYFTSNSKNNGSYYFEEQYQHILRTIQTIEEEGVEVPTRYTEYITGYENFISGNYVDGDNDPDLMQTISGDELLEEDNISWAVGIAGGIQFPIKGFDTKLHANILLARNNRDIDFRINEILLKMEQSAFKLNAAASLSFSGSKTGFEAQAEVETIKKKFGAGFKYYKYNGGGFELGANLLVKAHINTGPVTWHSIGGGFNFNTAQKKYYVWVEGSLGPVGTPPEVMLVDDAKIDILFDNKACGDNPVISGYATLKTKGQEMGRLFTSIDFCRSQAYLKLSKQMDVLDGLAKMDLNGLVYVFKDGNQGRAYLGLSAYVQDKYNILKGNGQFSLGINFRPTSHTPSAVINHYNALPSFTKPNNRFNGLFLNANLTVPSKNGSFGISIGSFDLASFKYSASASAKAQAYKSFDNNKFLVKGNLKLSAGGKLIFLGSTFVGGKATANLNVNGGRDYSWYFNASGNINMEVYNKSSLNCGTVKIGTFEWCTFFGCVTLPKFMPDFKTCFGVGFSAKSRQGQGTSVSFNKN